MPARSQKKLRNLSTRPAVTQSAACLRGLKYRRNGRRKITQTRPIRVHRHQTGEQLAKQPEMSPTGVDSTPEHCYSNVSRFPARSGGKRRHELEIIPSKHVCFPPLCVLSVTAGWLRKHQIYTTVFFFSCAPRANVSGRASCPVHAHRR